MSRSIFLTELFDQSNLDSSQRKNWILYLKNKERKKSRKVTGLDKIPPDVWKTRKFDDIFLRLCNAVYEENAIEKWTKGYIPRFVKKDDLSIVKNYKGITITAIAVKVYNTLLLNRVNLKIEKILRKNQNDFWRNQSTASRFVCLFVCSCFMAYELL